MALKVITTKAAFFYVTTIKDIEVVIQAKKQALKWLDFFVANRF